MTSEEKVKRLWPNAKIERLCIRNYPNFKVTIMPGRYTYGRMKSWAWKSALDSIVQDEELCNGERGSTHG